MFHLTDRELGAVLAGLRMYQDCPDEFGGDYYDIATDGGSFRALDHPEVDDLCERLNDPYPPQTPLEFTKCSTCGALGTTFVDGDCPKCNPPTELGSHPIREHNFDADDIKHYDTPTCMHRAIDDCMFCITCGECREDLFEDDECPDCKEHPAQHMHLSPDFLDGVRTGIAALREGRITSWEDVKQELGLD